MICYLLNLNVNSPNNIKFKKGIYRDIYKNIENERKKDTFLKSNNVNKERKGIYKDIYRQFTPPKESYLLSFKHFFNFSKNDDKSNDDKNKLINVMMNYASRFSANIEEIISSKLGSAILITLGVIAGILQLKQWASSKR